jgi:hypothetical protein
MTIDFQYTSTTAMELYLGMGMDEGLTQAAGQIDTILAEDAVAARGRTR